MEDQEIPAYQAHLADQAVGTTISDVYALQQNAPLVTMIDLKKMEIVGPALAGHIKPYKLSKNIEQQLIWMQKPAGA